LSKQHWAERQESWLSLIEAVFRFGTAEEDCKTTQTMPDIAEDGLWLDQLSKFLDEGRASFSLNQLKKILKAISHADNVDIDPEVYTFRFVFGNYSLQGDPWNLVKIKPIHTGAKVIEYLPGSNVILKRKHSPDANDKNRLIVQKATRLVWGQLMLGAFGRAVSMGEIVLYARTYIGGSF
jgi:hypothetical protein